MVRTIQSLGLFFKFSAKRQRILKSSIAEIHSDNEKKTKGGIKHKTSV